MVSDVGKDPLAAGTSRITIVPVSGATNRYMFTSPT